MNRRSILRKASVTGLLSTVIASPVVQAQPVIRWRLASSFPRQIEVVFGSAESFSERVSQLSGGRFEILINPAGVSTSISNVMENVQQGEVEVAHTVPMYYMGRDETFALDGCIPFGLNSRQLNGWYLEGGGQALLREFYEKFNLVRLICGSTGAHTGTWFKEQVGNLEEFKKLRFRVSGLAGRIFERMGATSVIVSGRNLFDSLADGRINAAEWAGPYDDQRLGLYKVAPFYSRPGWREGGWQIALFINSKAYAVLSTENKAILAAASQLANVEMQAKYDAKNYIGLTLVVGQGAKLFEMPDDIVEEAYKQSLELYDELSSRNENWKPIYESYSKWRNNQNLWHYFSERTFDNFMQLRRFR